MLRKTVVLFSGGMDSLIHLHWALQDKSRDTVALYVDLGHKYVDTEVLQVEKLTHALGVKMYKRYLPLGDIEQTDGHISLRNLYLLELATIYGDDIVFGMLYHETSEDKNLKFVRRMQRLFNSQFSSKEFHDADRQIRILTPFSHFTKTEILIWFLRGTLEDREALIRDTVSCYSPDGRCGRCMSCFNRWVAFENCGLRMEAFRFPPYEWGMEQLAAGKKRRQSLTQLSAIWFKRRYALELLKAYHSIIDDPIGVAWQVHRQKSILPFVEAMQEADEDLRSR